MVGGKVGNSTLICNYFSVHKFNDFLSQQTKVIQMKIARFAVRKHPLKLKAGLMIVVFLR